MKTLIPIFILMFSTFAFSVGNEGGHGGDTIGQEFVDIGNEIYKKLSQKEFAQQLKDKKISLDSFKKKLDSALVYSAPHTEVILNGNEVNSINYPDQNKIVINRDRWKELFVSAKLKHVFHEFLGLMKVELDTYAVSDSFKSTLNDLAQDIIRFSPQTLRYYASNKVYKALSELRDACDPTLATVSNAIEGVRKEAISRCETELRTRCESTSLNLKKIISPLNPGLIYCEISAESVGQ